MRWRCHLANITPAITIIEWYTRGYLHPESNGYIRRGQSIHVAEFDCSVVAERNFFSMACLPDMAFRGKISHLHPMPMLASVSLCGPQGAVCAN